MDDNAILNVRVRANDDRIHVSFGVYLISANNGIRSYKHVFVYLHQPTQDRRRIDEGAGMNFGDVAARIFSNHMS